MITPVLVEIINKSNHEISLFSGIEFNVDKNKGWNSIGDDMLSLSSEQLFLDAPIIAIVDAQNDQINAGLGQCISERWASQLYNHSKNNLSSSRYGVVTTGSLWRFFKLTDQTV